MMKRIKRLAAVVLALLLTTIALGSQAEAQALVQDNPDLHVHLLAVLADSPFYTPADLDNCYVVSGFGTATRDMSELALSTYDIDYSPVHLYHLDSLEVLKQGAVEAVLIPSGHPWSLLVDEGFQTQIRLLPWSQQAIAAVTQQFPDVIPGQLPANTYPSQIEPVPGYVWLNNPPYEPSNPLPMSGATNVPINASISWMGGDADLQDTVSYDVFFGTDPAHLQKVSSGQSMPWYYPGILNIFTTYYWFVGAIDNHGMGNQSSIWDFTTGSGSSPPSVSVWNCTLGGVTLIAPYPNNGRPYFNVAVDPAEITVSAGAALWGIYYLDETVPGGEWLYFIPSFTGNTLTQLEPGKFYYVVVSGACNLTLPM